MFFDCPKSKFEAAKLNSILGLLPLDGKCQTCGNQNFCQGSCGTFQKKTLNFPRIAVPFQFIDQILKNK